MTDNARIVREALDYIAGRLQLDVDDGGRPDQWSMEDMIRMARKAIPLLDALETELATAKAGLARAREEERERIVGMLCGEGEFVVAPYGNCSSNHILGRHELSAALAPEQKDPRPETTQL